MTESSNKNRVIVDSYAWIEYLKGTETGLKAKNFIDNLENELFTLDVCLAEIKFWALSANLQFESFVDIIRANSNVIETFSNDWLKAAEAKFEKRKTIKNIGLIDALIIVKSRELKTKILTGDRHFENEKQTILI